MSEEIIDSYDVDLEALSFSLRTMADAIDDDSIAFKDLNSEVTVRGSKPSKCTLEFSYIVTSGNEDLLNPISHSSDE